MVRFLFGALVAASIPISPSTVSATEMPSDLIGRYWVPNQGSCENFFWLVERDHYFGTGGDESYICVPKDIFELGHPDKNLYRIFQGEFNCEQFGYKFQLSTVFHFFGGFTKHLTVTESLIRNKKLSTSVSVLKSCPKG